MHSRKANRGEMVPKYDVVWLYLCPLNIFGFLPFLGLPGSCGIVEGKGKGKGKEYKKEESRGKRRGKTSRDRKGKKKKRRRE